MASSDTSLLSLLREELKCAICLQQLRKPRALTCLHSFCEKCLETYKEEKTTAGKIACPVCNKETVFTDEGIIGLMQDFRAMTLIERIEKETGKQKQKTKVTKLCEVCGAIQSTQASSIFSCAECKLVMCRKCANEHKHLVCAADSNSTHEAETGLENSDGQSIFCEMHGRKKKELFCLICLIPVCQDCSLKDHRRKANHECVPVEDFVRKTMHEEIQSRLSRLVKVYENCAGIIPVLRNAENLAQKQKDSLDKQFDDDIDQFIHTVKTDLKTKNEKFFELRNQTFSQWQMIIEDRIESIENIQLKAKGALEPGDQYIRVAASYKGLLHSLDCILSEAPEKYILQTISKVLEVGQLCFTLNEDELCPIKGRVFTKREVCERRDIPLQVDGDIRAITFTRDGRIAVLASVGGPSTCATTSHYMKRDPSGRIVPIPEGLKLYEHCRYSAIKQTAACSEVAKTFGIETRLDYSRSAIASLSDLRFVLDDCNETNDISPSSMSTGRPTEYGIPKIRHTSDTYYVTKLPGPISDMAVDSNDNIFCSVPSCKKIYVVRTDGKVIKSIPSSDLTPKHIAVCPRSPDQIIFTHDSSKVSVVDLSGKLVKTITRPEWKDVAIGCDNDRLLYILWKNEVGSKTLQRFHLNGDLLDTLFEGEEHSCSNLLLAVSRRGTAAVFTGTYMYLVPDLESIDNHVTIISATREFTGHEDSLPK